MENETQAMASSGAEDSGFLRKNRKKSRKETDGRASEEAIWLLDCRCLAGSAL